MNGQGRFLVTLVRHEFRIQIRTPLFITYTVSLTLLTVLAVLSGGSRCLEAHDRARLTTTLNAAIVHQSTSWEELGETGIFLVREVATCSPFRIGSGFVSKTIRLRTDSPPEQVAPLTYLLYGRLPQFSAYEIGVYWAALLALLMGSMIIAGEKQNRTLSMVWVALERRSAWLLCKWFGRLVPLWLGWILAYASGQLVGLLIMPRLAVLMNRSTLIADFLAYGFLFTFWFTVGMAISAFIHRVDLAALVGLTCWVAWEFFLPWSLYWFLVMTMNPPTTAEFYARLYTAQTHAWDRFERKNRELMRRWLDAALAIEESGAQQKMELQGEYEKSFKDLQDTYYLEWLKEFLKLESEFRSRRDRFLQTLNLLEAMSIPSRALAEALGLDDKSGMQTEVWNFWRKWREVVTLNIPPIKYIIEGEDPYILTRPNPEKIPRFTAEEKIPGGHLRGWLALLVLTGTAMASAFRGVARYEPQ